MKALIATIFICAGIPAFSQEPDSSAYYFSKAMEEKEAGRYLVASSLFEKALFHDPANKTAYLQNGYTYLQMKMTDKAKTSFTRLLEMDPQNQDAIRQLTQLYFNYHQYELAIDMAGKCRDYAETDRILGMSYYKTEDYPMAEKHLAAALQKNPADAEVAYTMGRNYLDMEAYTKAVPFYDKAVQLDDTRNVWMYELGLLYYNLNNFKSAMAAFKMAAEKGYVQSNDFKENLGYASLYSGEYESGESLLLAVWQRKPGSKDILRDMAEIFYQQKQYDKSLSYCQKLMELDLKDGKALYQAGLCFQKKGQKDRGQQMCDKAIEMDPSLASLRRKKEMPGM